MVLLLHIVGIALAMDDGVVTVTTTDNQEGEKVCVTLKHYGNMSCKGAVQGINSFEASTAPGSPCRHTANMKDNSVTDQYCDLTLATFHQKVYVGSTTCHVAWYQKAYSPQHMTYTASACTYGYKLGSCTLGPCPSQEESETQQIDREIFQQLSQQLRREPELET